MIENTLRKRRAIRRFRNEPISRETLEKLIEMAIQAPSASNKQAWRFFVVDKPELIQTLADTITASIPETAALLEPAFAPSFVNYSSNFSNFRTAPALIIPTFREVPLLTGMLRTDAPQAVRDSMRQFEHQSGLISVSLAMQNLLLAAHDIGLGTCVMTGPLLAREKIQTLFGIPDGWQIAALIPVGHPDETPESPGRKPVKQALKWVE